ncbi:MAG: hypothetical protein M3R52_02980 [Acidobacteriota bacterium]|nr:hypothetical protein [Acidobacteriota bacterium]
MRKDQIVEETRKTREEYAARFDYDLAAIRKDLIEQQNRAPQKVVTLPPKEPLLLPRTNAS